MRHIPVLLVISIHSLVFRTGSSDGSEDDKTKGYVNPLDTPVSSFEIQEPFEKLTKDEKMYAHYMSRASWYGGLIIPVQTSPEAPAIVSILLQLFKAQEIPQLEEIAKNKCQFSDNDWKALVLYSAAVFHNIGNYRSYTATKTVPGVTVELFEKLLSVTKILEKELVKEMWNAVKDKMYSLSDNEKKVGHFANEGVTTYFSSNCTKEDADLVARFMKDQKKEAWMTRVFKTAEKSYEIRTAAVNSTDPMDPNNMKKFVPIKKEFEGVTFTLTTGDYSHFMKKVCENLQKAKSYAAPMEINILNHYNNSFWNGSLEEHKNASTLWLDNKNPSIETVIGFIETDRDPASVKSRSEFEGIVAIVDKSKKAMYDNIVVNADKIFACLPWEPVKNNINIPPCATWQVLTYATSRAQLNVRLPNYKDIIAAKGVKTFNVSNLTPSESSKTAHSLLFLSDADKNLLNTHYKRICEIRKFLFEFAKLSGKELRQAKNTKEGDENIPINFPKELINPITGMRVISAKVYEPEQEFADVFKDIQEAYECFRRQCIISYLFLFDEILTLHGVKPEEFAALKRAHLIFAVQDVLLGFEQYVPEKRSSEQTTPKVQSESESNSYDGWKTNQRCKGFFAMLKMLQKVGLVEIKEDQKGDVIISVETSTIFTEIRENKLKPFVEKLNVYKATADVERAKTMFEEYASMSDDWLKWHKVIVRTIDAEVTEEAAICLCHNTIIESTGSGGEKAALKTYKATHVGIIESWVDRFSEDNEEVCDELRKCWLKDRHHFEHSPPISEAK